MTLRGFVVAAGALGALLVLDQGEPTPPLVIECAAQGPALLSEGEEAVVRLDPALLAATPLPLPEVRPLPPFDVDAVRGEITSPLGGVEHIARAVRALSEQFPGRSVLSVAFATSDPDTPLHLSARRDDPMVLSLGDETFEMDRRWP